VVAGEFSVRGEEDYYYDVVAAFEFCLEEVELGRRKAGLLLEGGLSLNLRLKYNFFYKFLSF
jgi:hypothetical protein